MRYQIIDNGVVVDVTDSFSQAVVWAKVGEYSVYDDRAHKLVYDGFHDELTYIYVAEDNRG